MNTTDPRPAAHTARDQPQRPPASPPRGTQGDRTGRSLAVVPDKSVGPVPFERADVAPVRVLLVASPRLGYVAGLVGWVRANVRPVDTLVVRVVPPETPDEPPRDVAGAERAGAALARRLGATVETTSDAVAELERVDCWLAGVHIAPPTGWVQRGPDDEVPTQVVLAATAAGLPGVLRHEGGYPMPVDAESVAAQRRAAAWSRERARLAEQAERDEQLEQRRAAAGPVRGAARSMDDVRREAWAARQGREAG